MARPKKNDSKPEARERIVEAFWELLEDYELHEISIGMIVAKAGCNRGTFYYHFVDKDALVTAIIDNELLGENLPQKIFNISTSSGNVSLSSIITSQRIRRRALFVRRGGGVLVERQTKTFILRMWEAALCADGSALSDEARCVIEYCSSGMLGLMTYMGSVNEGESVVPPTIFLMELADIALGRIREAQGLSEEELSSRLAIVTQMSSIMENSQS